MKSLICFIPMLFSLVYLNAQNRHNQLNQESNVSILNIVNESITAEELSAQLHFIASDFFEGRKAGSKGERAVAHYLASFYKSLGIPPLKGNINSDLNAYFQDFTFSQRNSNVSSQNVIAFIEGSDEELKNEVIMLIAHYDHLGFDESLEGDSIFNGAADDGSGTVALLELAEAYVEAKKQGLETGRSILLLHTGAEESGLQGSTFFARNPPIPLEKIYAVINLDGVGSTDKPGAENASNYVYLLQNDSTSLPLAELTQKLNTSNKINLDILKPQNPERYNSDHEPFEFELIRTIYFSSGLTEHYHKVSDEPSTINYDHMAKISKLIFTLSWHLGNNNVEQALVERNQFKKTGLYYCKPCGCASDNKQFNTAGSCPDCAMPLQPRWEKSNK